MSDPRHGATGPIILDELLQLRGLLESLPTQAAALQQQNAVIAERLSAIEQRLTRLERQIADFPRQIAAAHALAVGDPARDE
jgi:chromosome segregation ATPase